MIKKTKKHKHIGLLASALLVSIIAITACGDNNDISDDMTAQEESSGTEQEENLHDENEAETKEEEVSAQENVSMQTDARAMRFQTTTLDGSEVTDEILKDYDITIVHMWGTYCGPCIAEMGEYAQFYKNRPENVNLVGLVCDVIDGEDSNVDAANDILSDAGAEFTNLRLNREIYEITSELQFVPSSFFVDSEGNILGDMLDGAGFDDTINQLETLMN